MEMKHKSPYYILAVWILYWVVFQDFILAILYNATGNKLIVNLLFYSKDVIFVGLTLYTLLFKKTPTAICISFYGIAICILISTIKTFLFSKDVPITQILQNIRMIILLSGFVIVGIGIKDKLEFKKFIVNRYFPFLVFCAFIGIIEYVLDILVGTRTFWLNIVGITNYYTDIKGEAGRLVAGFPGNFYGDYGNGFFSSKRMVGFWMGPLTSGYALLVPLVFYTILIFAFKDKSWRHIGYLIILMLAVLLTHTRAIILVYIAIMLLYALYHLLLVHKKFLMRTWIVFFGIASIILCIILLNIDSLRAILFDGSTRGHVLALFEALNTVRLSLFGSGINALGIAGETGTESSYVTLMGNVGLIGLILYLIPLVYASKVFFGQKSKDVIAVTMFLCMIAYALTGVISEQLFAYTSLAPFYMMLGCYISSKQKYRTKRMYSTANQKAY